MLEPIDTALPVGPRALASLARTRAVGLHFFGHFLGIAAVSNRDGRSVLILDPARDAAGGVASTSTEFATLADLALGSAIRSTLGPGLRLGTTSLAVNNFEIPAAGRLEAEATTVWSDREALEGHARAQLTDCSGARIATADGWFVALAPPPGTALPPVPWESDDPHPEADLGEADLDVRERACYDAVLAAEATARRRGIAVAHQLIDPGERTTGGAAEFDLEVSPALGNRVGQMQGGALYGAAAAAASAALGEAWQVASGYVQYLRPVDGPYITLRPHVVREGRRVAFTDVVIETGGRTALVGRFTHRPR